MFRRRDIDSLCFGGYEGKINISKIQKAICGMQIRI